MAFFSSSFVESNISTTKTLVSTAASIITTIILMRSVAQDHVPKEIRDYLFGGIRRMFHHFSSQFTIVINEFNGLINNQIYDAAHTYLSKKISPSTRRVKVSKPNTNKGFKITMDREKVIVDVFNGIKFKWVFVCKSKSLSNSRDQSKIRALELSFQKKHKELVLMSYIPFIMQEAKSTKQEVRTLQIFTVNCSCMYNRNMKDWLPMKLDHPSTFETLALDSDIKKFILEDLERFVRRKEYYKKVGKEWKRGYLLYGPPGIGKSSLIEAMGNYLHFDIYDLESTRLGTNLELRQLMISMENRAIIIVKDIDYTIHVKYGMTAFSSSNQRQVILSRLLNFIDVFWSCCGDGRIIVFTANCKEKLDPALLRPGRLDVHIHVSYCTAPMFRQLAWNYLELKHHPFFPQIEEAILATHVTPAEVAQELLKTKSSSDNHHSTLQDLLHFLAHKKIENEEFEAKKEENITSSCTTQGKTENNF